MISGKIWGQTENIFEHNNISIHRIFIKKGGVCSKHYHKHKYNMFYVESGLLKISVWQDSYDLVDETILFENSKTTVSPGLYHMFEALEDTVAYEIYYLSLDNNDIIRQTCGYLK